MRRDLLRGTPWEQLAVEVRRVLGRMDPKIPLAGVCPMAEVMALSVTNRRLNVLITGAFALLAIGLATVGVYEVMAYDVLAAGARRCAGSAAAALLSGSLSTLLFNVGPRDLAVFTTVALRADWTAGRGGGRRAAAPAGCRRRRASTSRPIPHGARPTPPLNRR